MILERVASRSMRPGATGMRRYPLLALPILVSGCALPPAVVIASYAADGVSYISSGKSLEDHGLSAVMDQDCALHRVLMEKPICSDFKPTDVTASAGSPPDGTAAPRKGEEPSPAVAPAIVAAPSDGAAASPPPRAPTPTHEVGWRRYLVLGSFSEHERAARFAKALGQPKLAVVAVDLQGR